MTFEVKDIYKRFGAKAVLKGISFHTKGGRALGLLGRNGAGKTTAIRIIMGVFPADSGQVLLDGESLDSKRVSIGYLPEEHGLYPRLVIDDQMLYLAKLRGMKTDAAKQAIQYWIGRLGLQEYKGKRLDTLSKGNQQKIQLAATLMTDPDFIILDEPFSGLDPVNAALLKDVVKELIQAGKLVLFSSHQMNYVEEFCDSVAILHQGSIVLSGEISEIKRSYDRSLLVIRSLEEERIKEYCKTAGSQWILDIEEKHDGLLVRLKDPRSKNALLESLAQQSFDLDSICVYEPSLEDIFVQYTGDDHKEGGEAHETAENSISV